AGLIKICASDFFPACFERVFDIESTCCGKIDVAIGMVDEIVKPEIRAQILIKPASHVSSSVKPAPMYYG
ncbi:MAG: hypothetical protein AAF639_20095, partial [Chloroflexota bacterium]